MEEYEITIRHKGKFVKATVPSRSLKATEEEVSKSYLHIDAECEAVMAVEQDCKKTMRALLVMLKEYEEQSENARGRFTPIVATIDGVHITVGDIDL
jgi:hypothetical protein